jgi:hypothetical protein
VFGTSGTFPQGHHQLSVACEAAGMRLHRKLAAGFAQPGLTPSAAPDLAGRRRQALDDLARRGNPQIGRALAIAAVGGDPGLCAALIEDALDRIAQREDCSDFWMPPLLWLLRTWPRMLGQPLRERARQAILRWRYWMDEPGNDVMWFWSENHALCFHAAQYLAGQAFPDDVLANSGRTGREQRALGRERLLRWFEDVEEGGFIEWHSPAYYRIDCIGLLALHELAADAAIRAAARRALDRLFLLIALSTLNGIPSSTQGRTYDRDLKLPALTETSALAWIEWGKGALNPMGFAVPLLCLGSYTSPAAARRIALWEEPLGVQARYSQGRARLVSWKSRDALLGSVVDYHPGAPGYQAVVTQAHLEGHPDARIWISNPGQDDPFGTRRPSYWAGDGVMPQAAQWRNLALLHYRLNDPRAIPGRTPISAARSMTMSSWLAAGCSCKAVAGLLPSWPRTAWRCPRSGRLRATSYAHPGAPTLGSCGLPRSIASTRFAVSCPPCRQARLRSYRASMWPSPIPSMARCASAGPARSSWPGGIAATTYCLRTRNSRSTTAARSISRRIADGNCLRKIQVPVRSGAPSRLPGGTPTKR